MHINLGTILRLLGVDLSRPLAIIEEVAQLVGPPALAADLSTHLTDARRAELAVEFRAVADDLDAKNFDKAASDILGILSGIKA
jgi:hypothetical protein